ncbi:MAG: hypothetical protein OEW15_12410 [Nitrospirota bacterium]|nr:hypothetical protein [Nitrospirota bacterium]
MRPNTRTKTKLKRPPQHQRASVDVDIESLLSIENRCGGCAQGERCCCSSFDVCVTPAEMKRIIKVLPSAAKFASHLRTDGGYDNVFDEEEQGLHSIDTTEDGLCLFAYRSKRRIHCSLHSAAAALGLPLARVKPKVCLLWPLHFSEGEEVLSIHDDALVFACNSGTEKGSRELCRGFVDAIELVYGAGCGDQVRQAAERGERRTRLAPRH